MTRWHRASWTLRWVLRTWPRGKDGRDPVTWIWKAFRERLTPGGKALGGILLGLLPISVLTRGGFGGASFALVSAVLATGWILSLRSPAVSAKMALPATLREGKTVTVRILLHTLGASLPTGLGAWIFRTGDGLEAVGDGAMAVSTSVRSGTVEVPLRALRRGRYAVEGATILCCDPLGFFRARSLESARANILVLPRICRVPSLDNLIRGPGEAEFARALETATGGNEIFAGIRPWRSGDNIRQIHHRAWARTGHPIVRESEVETDGGIVLVFHSGGESWSRRSLMDPAISLCGGIARFLSERGALSGFFLDDARIPLGRRDPVLAVESALACLPASGGWERHRHPAPWRRDVSVAGPVLQVGFSRGFPDQVQRSPEMRGVWIDWNEENPPEGIFRVDPEQILSESVRL